MIINTSEQKKVEFLFTTKEDLQEVFGEALRGLMIHFPPQKEEQNLSKLSIDGAILFLEKMGCPLSKSALYKKTMKKEIPFHRFGAKKILFMPEELKQWAEARCSSSCASNLSAIKTLTSSAKRKGGKR